MADRTEQPTSRRTEEAREEGRVAKSVELNSAVIMLVSVFLLAGPGVSLLASLKGVLVTSFTDFNAPEVTEAWLRQRIFSFGFQVAPYLGLIMVALLGTSVVATVVQTGGLWAGKRMGFDFKRINPLSGFQRIFSAQGLIEFGRQLLKLSMIIWIVYSFLSSNIHKLLVLSQTDLLSAVETWFDMAKSMATQIGEAYLILAGADYIYQRWQYSKSMKMTKEEVKEDSKRSEGDPFIKGRIRQQQRRMARMRMMSAVPKASVIVTNPTHLAVALEYNPEKMPAPRVVAKGAHLVAERIVKIAKANNIPVVQNIPVARAMYRTVEVDQEIPAPLYMAVAEILAYVFKMRKKSSLTAQPDPVS